jgi:hypothetical protein
MKIAVDADKIGIQLLASLTGVEEGEGKGDDFIKDNGKKNQKTTERWKKAIAASDSK